MDWFVRITESYDTLEGFIHKLAEECSKLIVYEHGETSRKHIHFYARECKIKTDAIKTRVKKHLNIKAYEKNKWSFKTADDDGCIVYMTKGRLEPMFVKGFTQEEVSSYKDKWVERTPETSSEKKSGGPTQYDMAMEVYEIVKTRKATDLHTIEVYELCMNIALDVLHKHRKGFDENSIRKVVQPAYTKLEHCRQQFVQKLVHNFFR